MPRFSSSRASALVIATLGGFGLLSTIVDLVLGLPPTMIPRPDQPPTMDSLLRNYPTEFAIAVSNSVLIVVLALVFFELLRHLYRKAPLESLVGGLFLGGSILCGLLVGLIALKTNEFVLQAAAGSARHEAWYSPEQHTWLHNGIYFLMQIHVVFGLGHVLLLGLGWVAVALGLLRAEAKWRLWAVMMLLAGVLAVARVALRAWLPVYTGDAPLLDLLQGFMFKVSTSFGYLASAILAWRLAGKSPNPSSN